MARQTEQAIVEADAVILVTDARAGLAPGDRVIAERLRRLKQRVWIAVNKAEGLDPEIAAAEFHELGLGRPAAISAAHGAGVGESHGIGPAAVSARTILPMNGTKNTLVSRSSAGRTSANPRW